MKIFIIVHPNAKRPRIEEKAGILHVYVSQPPVEGRANAAVTAALAEHFHINKSRINLVHGTKSKTKTIEIVD